MLGTAELPIAILAWTIVVVLYAGVFVTTIMYLYEGWEKASFERERKRRDKIREQAKQNILVINKGESRNEEVQS